MVGIRLEPAARLALKYKIQTRKRFEATLGTLRSIPARRFRRGVSELSIDDYPKGRFVNLHSNRLRWVSPNYFEFIPKRKSPFKFVRSSGEEVEPRNFFTDGASIPRLFHWGDSLDPFGGALPGALLHDWEFDLHHCKQTPKTFEDVNATLMEALRTLMETHVVPYDARAFWMIETGVNSFIGRAYWDQAPAGCSIPPYSPE